jgi:hypothetical protein
MSTNTESMMIAERLAAGEDARQMVPIPFPVILGAITEPDDASITQPNKILLYGDGSVLAVHHDTVGDVAYRSQDDFESAYGVRCSK